uniref:CG4686-PA n=1 Tax=Drosophila pseudoobscura pseudoobscura TaxID=46245 RepID=Q8I160_DROPS|nr:CG4686-PA [Drosophila pseudoobscura]
MMDTLDYITLSNPVSKAVIYSGSAIFRALGLRPKQLVPKETQTVRPVMTQYMSPGAGSLHNLAGRYYHFVRLAGLGGASAIFMGAYCKYVLKEIKNEKEQLDSQAFADVANRIHFLHSFALMAMPLAHYPIITGSLMTTGTLLFSGCMYYRALTGEKRFQPFATVGGFCLIAAWLTLIF